MKKEFPKYTLAREDNKMINNIKTFLDTTYDREEDQLGHNFQKDQIILTGVLILLYVWPIYLSIYLSIFQPLRHNTAVSTIVVKH